MDCGYVSSIPHGWAWFLISRYNISNSAYLKLNRYQRTVLSRDKMKVHPSSEQGVNHTAHLRVSYLTQHIPDDAILHCNITHSRLPLTIDVFKMHREQNGVGVEGMPCDLYNSRFLFLGELAQFIHHSLGCFNH